MSRTDVRDSLNDSDLLLITSISEGSPQVIKEALACNIPVVSTPVGDLATILKDIPFCKVSRSHQAHELAQLSASILHTRNCTGIRDAFLKKGIDQKSICRNIVTLYRKVINDGK